jgi:hypothetical protein
VSIKKLKTKCGLLLHPFTKPTSSSNASAIMFFQGFLSLTKKNVLQNVFRIFLQRHIRHQNALKKDWQGRKYLTHSLNNGITNS